MQYNLNWYKNTFEFQSPHSTLLVVHISSTMKLFALLALILVQETLCTHLETCECHEIRELVNTTVQRAVAGLEKRLSLVIDSAVSNINTTDTATLENLETRLAN